jgi:hypothetical protein
MIVSLFATIFFCGLVIAFFGVIFFLSKKVGVPDASYGRRFRKRAYWNRIFFSSGVTRGSLKASERFSDLMPTIRPLSIHKRYQRRPWEPR